MTSPAQRVQLQPAFVLHRRPYRETSWLLEVFSRDHGRLGLVARAARQSRKRSGAALEPARELLLSWTLRGELGLLVQSESVPGMSIPEGESLLAALYLNELLMRLTTRHDPHPQLYAHYRDALAALTRGFAAAPLRMFELHLLRELGYGLNLERDSLGNPIQAGVRYDYGPGQGARPLSVPPTGVALEGEALLALREGRLTEAQGHGEIKHLLRMALAGHLGDRPLKTPELLRSLRRLRPPTPGVIESHA